MLTTIFTLIFFGLRSCFNFLLTKKKRKKKLEKDLKPKEIKPSIVSQYCVAYKFAYDLCDARIMFVIQSDTFINALPNTSTQISVNTFYRCMHGDKNRLSLMGANLLSSRSAMGNLTALFTKCYSSKN